ncbi:MAG TPA: hypothetical protein VGH19_10700 [Verrucomicrobiae bacterium]
MKLLLRFARKNRGFALLLVLVFISIGLLLMTASLSYTSNSAQLNERNNQYNSTMLAAEAATEKVVGNMIMDFKTYGQPGIANNMNNYRAMVPTYAENTYWSSFQFSDAQGNTNKTYVGENGSSYFSSDLGSSFSGLGGTRIPYKIVSNARMVNGRFTMTNAVQQEVAFTTIPIFQYAIFYNDLLEFVKAATMNIRGRVHSNGSIYVGGSSPVTFFEDVTAVGVIIKPGLWNGVDTVNSSGVITFNQEKTTNGVPMSLPIGTNNSSAAVHKVIERPDSGEAPNSAMGKERYYNKSEILLLVSNNVVSMSVKTPFSTTSNAIPTNHVLTFVTTNKSMYDQRQDRTQLITEIDVAKFKTFIATNTVIASTLGSTVPSLLYVDDSRGGYSTNYTTNIYNTNTTSTSWPGPIVAPKLTITTNLGSTQPNSGGVRLSDIPGNAATNWLYSGTAGQSSARYRYKLVSNYTLTTRITNVVTTVNDGGMGAVRLTNGISLPSNGLTVSTPNGLYVAGSYNCPTAAHLGTTNTSDVKPASLVCDALTILSSNWKDSQGSASYTDRDASDTTVNAAILTGNVKAGGTNGDDPPSGGAHNLPRFLEDWSNRTCTINGSLVCLFESQQANGQFVTTGQTDTYYNPPTRNWSFDKNFLNPNKLPPGTPAVRVLERLKWTTPPPNSTTYAGY